MATQTTNYGFIKPEKTDPILIDQLNENMDKIDAALANKVDEESGKGLSTNDFTDADKSKLDDLENYNDTDVKANVSELASQATINKSTLGYQRKNLLQNTAVSGSHNGVQYTVNADGSVTTGTGTITGTVAFLIVNSFTFKAGVKYILSGSPNNGSTETRISLTNVSSGTETEHRDIGLGVAIKFDTDTTYNVRIRFGGNGAVISTPITFYPMIRYAEITDDTYEPYKPSVEERINNITDQIFGIGTNIPSGADLNNYTNVGVYYAESSNTSNTLSNNPHKTTGFRLEVCNTSNQQRVIQKLIPNSALGVYYHRIYTSSGFSSWYKFTGEAVETT